MTETCVEGRRQVGDLEGRPVRHGVDMDRYDIEADSAPSTRGMIGDPSPRAAHDPGLLAFIDRFFGAAVASGAPGLDLDEGQPRAAGHDQVDLDPSGPDVAGHDSVAFALEKFRSTRFALVT